MAKMTFNGVELELDLMDAEEMEKFEDQLEKIRTDIAEPTQYVDKKNSEQMKLQCNYVKAFFDKVFGAGTAQKLFDGKYNLAQHMEAFGICANMPDQIGAEVNAITQKYSPNRVQNREQRRAHGKKHKGNYYR